MSFLVAIFFAVSTLLFANSLSYEKETISKRTHQAEVLSAQTKLVSQELDIIIITVTPTPSPTLTPSPIPSLTPTPLPTQPVSSSDIESWFDNYSNQYGVSKELLKKIAWCESHYNPAARNGPFGGMFQFTAKAWENARARMGADQNSDLRYHAEESIKTAAYKISQDGTRAWKNCAK
ncbi:transglycosylase SLT domain-containing protein [Candidatus Gottesmanbacteria bacterium]|nr:transglycosylase SLT domain-containing protein [Candidatus Gottesmanbacteria bacterium]